MMCGRNLFSGLMAGFLFVLGVMAVTPCEAASGYPTPKDDYVNDYADVLDPSDLQMLRNELKRLEEETGIEGTVLTINSMLDYKVGIDDVELFTKGLFDEWGVGDHTKNNGFMILVAIKDRKCRVELGFGYGKRYDAKMQEIMDQVILPKFKSLEYSQGLYDGTNAVVNSLTRRVSFFEYYLWEIIGTIVVIVCILAGVNCIKNGKTGWGYFFFATAGVILFGLMAALISKGRGGFGGGRSGGGGASGSW